MHVTTAPDPCPAAARIASAGTPGAGVMHTAARVPFSRAIIRMASAVGASGEGAPSSSASARAGA